MVTVRAWARVASRTKRATLPARIKMSPRQVALALLAAFADGSKKVDEKVVKSVAEGLDLIGGTHGKR